MLRAFTSLEVNSAGQYDLKHIKSEPWKRTHPLLLMRLRITLLHLAMLPEVTRSVLLPARESFKKRCMVCRYPEQARALRL